MAGSVSDEAFARVASEIGAVTFDHLEAARKAQAEAASQGRRVPLAVVLLQQGVITPIQRDTIEKRIQSLQAGGIKQLGPYKLLKKLGEGGMGAVYLADDTSVGRKVAVKVLPKKYAEEREFLTRFRREAQATGKLNHVNIVVAYNVGEDAGTHYYAMEHCDGDTLDSILKRDKVIPWDAATAVVLQAARGLKHAHEHGIIHRDIKPANIFVCKPLGTPEGVQVETFAEGFVAKILDLGLSKNISGDEQSFYTQTGVAMGTPHYISPEQAKGEKGIDGRTDIYSLGATFYHLVTGQTPFQGSTAALIMMKHLSEELPNPQDVNPDIPEGVAQIIAKMMAKDQNDRYATCKDLLDDLELVIDGKTPSSATIDVGKSSVAVARMPRRVTTAPRKTAGPVPPVGTREHQPVERRATGRARRGAALPELVPVEEAASRRKLYAAFGILGVGLLVFILALTMTGGGEKPETRNPKVEGNEKPVGGRQQPVAGSQKPVAGSQKPVAGSQKVAAAVQPGPAKAGGDADATEKGVTDAWIKSVQALSAEKQVEEVVKKLKELNPGYDGEGFDGALHRIEGGTVVELRVNTRCVRDIGAVRGLPSLRKLMCVVPDGGKTSGVLSDLSPLREMPLEQLYCSNNQIADLSALRAMPLKRLNCGGNHNLGDVSPLAGMRLELLSCNWTKVKDLRPLIGMPLSSLSCDHTDVSDLSPLRELPLKELLCDFKPERDAELLRSIKTLERINNIPAAEFWKKVDAELAAKAATWAPLDISSACNADVIATLAGAAAEPFSTQFSTAWASKGLAHKLGMRDSQLPDDGCVALAGGPAFQMQMGEGKDAILLGAPGRRQPQPVTVELPAQQRRAYLKLAFLHASVAGDSDLHVILRYENNVEERVKLHVFDWIPEARQSKPDDATATACYTRTVTMDGKARGNAVYMMSQTIPANPSLVLKSLTVSTESNREVLARTVNLSFYVAGVFAVSGLPATQVGGDRPWKPIFDGKTLECLRTAPGYDNWRVEDGALVKTPGSVQATSTIREFEDGEIRFRFEFTGTGGFQFTVRLGRDGGIMFNLGSAFLGAYTGNPHEVVFSCRGDQIEASLDGKPVKLQGRGSRKGCLQFDHTGGKLRVLSIEYREPPPAAAGDRPWKPIFDGKTLECLGERTGYAWRVENGSIVNAAMQGDVWLETKEKYGDGAIRVRYRTDAAAYLQISLLGGEGNYLVILGKRELAGLAGKDHELIFTRRGEDVSALLDGEPVQVQTKMRGGPGRLKMFLNGGVLQVHSIEYRELAPAQRDADADRPWKPIFDGKTTECLDPLEGTWRIENGVIVNVPGAAKCQTKMQFGDGELRLQFQIDGCTYLEILPTNSPSCLEGVLRRPQLEALPGKRGELLLKRRGTEVSATVNGEALELKPLGAPFSQGHLRLLVGNGSLRILSIEFRAPAPERLEVGQKDKDGWTCIFNGRDLTGWEQIGKHGLPTIEAGMVAFRGSAEMQRLVVGANYELKGELRVMASNSVGHAGGISVRMAERGRASGPRILFSTDGDVSVGEANQATERAAAKVIVRGTWQTFRLSVIGATLGLDVDGKTVTRKTVSVTNGGRLALYAAAGTGAPHIEFKDLWLRELGPDAKPVDGGGR